MKLKTPKINNNLYQSLAPAIQESFPHIKIALSEKEELTFETTKTLSRAGVYIISRTLQGFVLGFISAYNLSK